MINRSIFCVNLSIAELNILIASKKWTGAKWDNKKPVDPNIAAIKTKLRHQLELVQTNCAYCGLKLNGTSRGQIEHIAPKAKYRYPQFTFTLKNLVMACGYCNGFDKKGTSNTIDNLHNLYKRCEFNIVHPYFDDPNEHYNWDDNNIEILISVKNNSNKAINSIDLFDLDTPMMSELRAQQIRFDEHKSKYILNQNDNNLLNTIMKND